MVQITEQLAALKDPKVWKYCQYCVPVEMNQMGMMVDTIKVKKTMRPPNLSVSMPSGSRINEPVSTGIATSTPNWVSFSPSAVLIGMPITANIIQTMKHTVNETVLAPTTDQALCFCVAMSPLPD